ncbi:hypothetical protein RvY_07243 [Ramazzottius varieornatus]|uniref:Programmed cell death protein 4 n=1 Tax=Ramazzottius varieornatus TaxID=947166 RepID=A0A1D1V417_RAMVA|nr:hypothetical protein RvY_07243 [Ramazzottius varieornatus]
MPHNESTSSKNTNADARRPDYNAVRTRSNEETEVDKLIQQLSTEETPTPAAGEESHQPQPTRLEQKGLNKHGMRHKISKGPGAASVAQSGGAPAFLNAKKEAAWTKNSRRPRNGYGPKTAFKKGGAGGKGVWGRLGDEMDYEEDMDAEAEDEPSEYDKQQAQKEEITTLDALRTALTPVLQEYFNHGKSAEVTRFLEATSIKPALAPMVAYVGVVVALDKKAAQREMTSHLLADLYEALLNEQQFEAAFSQLLQDLPDLTLDCPEATDVIANFTARAVADDCLAPKFLESSLEKMRGAGDGAQPAVKALEKARAMINMKHGLVRLDNVWGVAGSTRPVKQLIKKMHQILKEYMASSGDVNEALRSLRELEVPHFHHEFVYETALITMEDGSDRVFDLAVKLLKVASEELVLTVDQLTTGFHRLYEDLIDIVLDVPNAYTATEKFATQCQKEGIIPTAVLNEFPTRGRKRYVSENDGGALKEDTVAVEEFRQRVASNAAHIEEEEESDNE